MSNDKNEVEILDKIETGISLERRDIETIKRYVAAGFWVVTIGISLAIISRFM